MTDRNLPPLGKAPINRRRSRIQFLLLGLLFFLPFLLAYSAYWLFPNWSPEGRVNYGQLLNPTRSTPAFVLTDANGAAQPNAVLREHWTLVQIVQGTCDSACERELVLTRQLHAALGTKRERVQRVVIAAADADLTAIKAGMANEQPDLRWLQDAPGNPAIQFFSDAPANAVLLIDPLGSWLMIYPHAADEEAVKRDFKGMQKDINKLLRLSSIG